MAHPIDASLHLAGQIAKVGMFATIHRLGSSYARQRAPDATKIREARESAKRSNTSKPTRNDIMTALRDLITSDAALVREGICPPMTDFAGSLPQTATRLRDMFADLPKSAARSAAEHRQEVRDEQDTSGFPDYYAQNFHYQTGGYLTQDSARLYDLQVETLFSGTAGAMRRQALRPIADAVAGRDQRKLALLDVACGTGRLMGQISRSFPALPQTGIDLSQAYLDEARSHLKRRRNIRLLSANAETIPFDDQAFDTVTCCFLFHELPAPVRRTVIAEMARVLAPGGTMIFIDSLQLGDAPQLDGMLEAFPERYHEPYYRNYLTDDIDAAFTEAGLVRSSYWNAFLSKVVVRRRTAN